MPTSFSTSDRRPDRYELGENVILALSDVMLSFDPAWGPEWLHVCQLWSVADEAARELWQALRPDSIRFDPRSAIPEEEG